MDNVNYIAMIYNRKIVNGKNKCQTIIYSNKDALLKALNQLHRLPLDFQTFGKDVTDH